MCLSSAPAHRGWPFHGWIPTGKWRLPATGTHSVPDATAQLAWQSKPSINLPPTQPHWHCLCLPRLTGSRQVLLASASQALPDCRATPCAMEEFCLSPWRVLCQFYKTQAKCVQHSMVWCAAQWCRLHLDTSGTRYPCWGWDKKYFVLCLHFWKLRRVLRDFWSLSWLAVNDVYPEEKVRLNILCVLSRAF